LANLENLEKLHLQKEKDYKSSFAKLQTAQQRVTTAQNNVNKLTGSNTQVSFNQTSSSPSSNASVSSGNPATKIINGIECVLVKAGTFTMGSPASESDRSGDETQHRVTITKDFYISKYPVTQAQYQRIMGTNPSSFKGDNLPVENVTWFNADDFCRKVGGRLPTEAEWEFAARGGNNSKGYIYSGSNNLNAVGWFYDNSGSSGNRKTQPVGQKSPNELGIYDMSGNVWEWCSNWYGSYPSGAVTDPMGPSSGSNRVRRVGGWFGGAEYCRVAFRIGLSPSFSHSDLGFRVAFNSSN
jgi:formylglycine-generating enzyme required for sulfatase activity